MSVGPESVRAGDWKTTAMSWSVNRWTSGKDGRNASTPGAAPEPPRVRKYNVAPT